ncbi:MAG: PAS domain S-box protein [Deltaproteobacteria bacterium]|nr:MAG: PAS domain S-box protein [Deltaproteobacteria bacterium]
MKPELDSAELIAQLEEAQDVAGLGSWHWDVRADVVTWSRKLYEIYGLDPESFGASYAAYLERVHPDDRERVDRIVRTALETRQDMAFEERIVRPDGQVRWLRSVGRVRLGPDGEVAGMTGTCLDITGEKQRAIALEELEAYAYTVSHDLKQPLRAVDGFARALAEEYGDRLDDTAREYLDRIAAAVEKMSGMIDGLLALSRVARGARTSEPVDLAALARRAAADLRAADPRRDVRFDIAESLPVAGDPRLLAILVDNLLGNAWKFTAGRAPAVIEVGRTGDGALFVRDNGAGFDPTAAADPFEPFARLHSSSEFAGTGVGLATVKRIVDRHGGRVWIESAPGAGTTVYFTLP